jgi:hypothetical protein
MNTLLQLERLTEPSTAIGTLVATLPWNVMLGRHVEKVIVSVTFHVKRGLILREIPDRRIFCELFIRLISRS